MKTSLMHGMCLACFVGQLIRWLWLGGQDNYVALQAVGSLWACLALLHLGCRRGWVAGGSK